MHEGCTGTFDNGKQVLDKVRMMGFSKGYMPIPLPVQCECGNVFQMETFEGQCPKCKMVFAVTPCHAFDPDNIMPAGKGV